MGQVLQKALAPREQRLVRNVLFPTQDLAVDAEGLASLLLEAPVP